jgi:hypothetical protein
MHLNNLTCGKKPVFFFVTSEAPWNILEHYLLVYNVMFYNYL